MSKGITELIEDSARYQLENELGDLGWSDYAVTIGYVPPEDGPPVVSVWYNKEVKVPAELGNSGDKVTYILDITIRGKNDGDMKAIKDQIKGCLHPLAIIDFNTAMPEDEGFDADAQLWATASVYQIDATIQDVDNNIALVAVGIQPNRII